MATSNSYDFTATRDEIIDTALRNAAGLGDLETATTTQVTKAAFLLNSIIKSYHTLGMPLWTNKKIEIDVADFTDGKVSIGLGKTVDEPKPQKISQVFLQLEHTTKELFLTDRQTLNRLNTTNVNTGMPSAVYYHPYRDYGDLHLYPVPDADTIANGTIVLWHNTAIQDIDASSHEIDFPVEWIRLIIAELSVDIAPAYGLPIQERNLLIQARDKLKLEAQNFDTEEGSILLQPNG